MLSINTDLTSGILQTTLNRNSEGVNRAIERLTTGYRINKAQDDAAGYAVAEKLSSKIDSMLKVQENAEHGIALLRTAEGGLNGIQDLLQRLRDLAVQASNDVYAEDSRLAMQSEANQLIEEINRIRNSTEFNGLNLFEGPAAEDTGSTGGVTTTSFTSRSRSIGLSNANVRINKIDDSGVNVSGSSNGAEESRGSFLSTLDEEIDSLSSSITSPTTNNAAAQSQPITFTPTPRAADITGAEDFGANETRTITIDGIDYQITNRLNSAQSFSYTKDTTTGEVTFLSSDFTILGQTDVEHNIIINGSRNYVYGGDLNDTILVTDSSKTYNYIYGGDGDDVINNYGRYGYVYGGNGNDTITSDGNNTLYGEAGNDVFTQNGTGCNAYGGDGDDSFTVSGSSNNFFGEGGEDSFNIISGSNNTVNGGEGTNSMIDNGTGTISSNVPGATYYSISFNRSETKIITINGIDYQVTCSGSNTNFTYSIDSTTNQITFSSTGNWTIRGDENKSHNVNITSGVVTFYGGNLSDTITANNNATIYSLDGNDNISVNNYSNVYCGNGNNNITVNGSMNYVTTGDGDNSVVITGNTSYNYIEMGAGDNTVDINGYFQYGGIYGGSGNNNTISGTIRDSLIAGFSDDVNNAEVLTLSGQNEATFNIAGKNYTISNRLNTSPNKTVLYSYNTITDTVSFSANQVNITAQADVSHNVHLYGQAIIFHGGDMSDEIVSDCRDVRVYGNGGNDILTHHSGGDSGIRGGDGDDEIIIEAAARAYGDDGNDTITVNYAIAVYPMDGGDGDDTYNINVAATVVDTGGNNIYNINSDNSNISGSPGDDTFYVNGNNNTILGQGGNDYFVVDGDNNTIDGGTGDNYYVINGSGSNMTNVTTDPNSGGISFTYQGEVQTFTLNGKTYTVTNNVSGTNMLQYSLNPNTGVITLNGSNFTVDSALDEQAILNIRGDNNTINGSSLGDRITIEQGSGNIINGLDGNDSLIMNSDNNSLNGDNGNDTITLNASTIETISGGAGDDVLNITSDGNTNIDAGEGNNRLNLSGSNNTVTSGDGDNTILSSGDSNIVTSGDGNNRITVTGNNNDITAGNGNNTVGVQGDDNIVTVDNASGSINVIGDRNSITANTGDNTITIRGDENIYTTQTGEKEINVVGNSNEIQGGDGDDTYTINGDGNIVTDIGGDNSVDIDGNTNNYTGSAGVDSVTIRGNNNRAEGGESNDSFMISDGRNNYIDGNGGDRNTMINNGVNTEYHNVVDITPRPFQLSLQVDTGSGIDDVIELEISFNLFDFSVNYMDSDEARENIADIDALLSNVSEQILNIGATINRLESVQSVQQVKMDNLISSLSTVKDVDISEESSNFIRNQILQNASSSLMTASRNFRGEMVLGLLGRIRR